MSKRKKAVTLPRSTPDDTGAEERAALAIGPERLPCRPRPVGGEDTRSAR
jgi:hypothetical protein